MPLVNYESLPFFVILRYNSGLFLSIRSSRQIIPGHVRSEGA